MFVWEANSMVVAAWWTLVVLVRCAPAPPEMHAAVLAVPVPVTVDKSADPVRLACLIPQPPAHPRTLSA